MGKTSILVKGSSNLYNIGCSLGTFSSTRSEIKTALITRWSSLALLYERWKVQYLEFHAIPAFDAAGFAVNSSGNPGWICMCMIEDPENSNYTSMAMMQEARSHITSGLGSGSPIVLKYRPKHTPWLYTGDVIAESDRWDMPADFMIGTDGFAAATSDLLKIEIYFEVAFDIPRTTSIGMPLVRKDISTSTSIEEQTNNVPTADLLRLIQSRLNSSLAVDVSLPDLIGMVRSSPTTTRSKS
jgi:hypothetical protein